MAQVTLKYSDYAYIKHQIIKFKILLNHGWCRKRMLNDRYVKIENRKLAIKKAIDSLKRNDILLVAGKGHENYQIIGKEKIHLMTEKFKEYLWRKMMKKRF